MNHVGDMMIVVNTGLQPEGQASSRKVSLGEASCVISQNVNVLFSAKLHRRHDDSSPNSYT